LCYVGNVRRFTCTGTIFRHTPYEMTILTSASLVRCLGDEAKFVNKLKVSSACHLYYSVASQGNFLDEVI
jgi:hypothetical protein